jgi:hypothetical protein
MQPAASKPKGKGGLQLPSAEVMAKLERSLLQNSPPNFATPAPEPAPVPLPTPAPEEVKPPAMEADAQPARPSLARHSTPRAKKEAVELPAANYGQKVRIVMYATPEDAAAIRKLAQENRRSESYVVGELVAEALKARPKR